MTGPPSAGKDKVWVEGLLLWRGAALSADAWRMELGARAYLVRAIRYGTLEPPAVPFTEGVVLPDIPNQRKTGGLGKEIWRLGAGARFTKGWIRIVWRDAWKRARWYRPHLTFRRARNQRGRDALSSHFHDRASTGPGQREDGDCNGIRHGIAAGGHDDVVGCEEWVSALLLASIHTRYVYFLLRWLARPLCCPAVRMGKISSVFYEDALAARAAFAGEAPLPSAAVYRRLLALAPPAMRPATKKDCAFAWRCLEAMFVGLGIVRQPSKVGLERAQRLDHFSVHVDTVAMKVYISEAREGAKIGTGATAARSKKPALGVVGKAAALLWRRCLSYARLATRALPHPLALLRHGVG